MFFARNIKILRQLKGLTQDEIAQELKTKRPTISGYENNVALPSIPMLIALADYFKISIDNLLRTDLDQLSKNQLNDLLSGYDIYVKGTQLRVLATTIDNNNTENIEVVNEKARAGYKSGYSDPEYISELPKFHLPFLSKEKKYRTFQITGDSMLPVPDRSFVTGEFVQDWNFIKTGDPCIVLTLDDGIVFKIVENNIDKDNSFKLISFNELYEPYNVHVSEIKEIWRFVNIISNEMPEKMASEERILNELKELRGEINEVKKVIRKK
jgi:transcriptional regulator with XRE-family HTH domain